MRKGQKVLRIATAVLCVVAVACFVTGCRASDALKEIIYEQGAQTVDYDNPNKYYINDSTAQEKSDQVSSKETNKDGSSTDTEQNLVVFGSDPNTSGYTAKKSAFSNKPDFNGIEASEKVFFYKSSDKDAIDHTVTKKQESKKDNNKNEDEEQEPNKAGDNTKKDQASENGQGGNGDEKAQEEKKDNKESTGASADETAGKKARKTDPTRVAYDSSDPSQKTPKVEKVAAYGEFATAVQMIAGDGALVATDAETLSGNFSKVFNTKDIVKAWSDGGSAKKMDVDKIVKSGAQMIVTSDAAYLTKLSDADFGKLAQAGIETIVLRPMTCSKYIKDDVTRVGDMFDGTSAGAYAKQGKTCERAKAYTEFHDRVLEACVKANGGSYAGKTVYQSNDKADVDESGTAEDKSTYTVLVNAYDENASYKGASLGSASWKPAKGLAYAAAGYATTPVSYYIQCGGLINNAAATLSRASSGEVPLWQFNYNIFGFAAKDWSGVSVDLLDDKAIKNASHVLLDSGINTANTTGLGAGLGSESMPKLIVTSSKIKNALIANSKKSNGMYTPYKWVPAGNGRNIESFGVNLGNNVLSSTVGSNGNRNGDGAANLLGSSIPASAICVSPTGLFSDWTSGTVESFLEAAWVSDEVNDNASGVDWEKEAESFYKTFYDYDLTASKLID